MGVLYKMSKDEICEESFDVGVVKAWFYESQDVDDTKVNVDADLETITAFELQANKKLVSVSFDDEKASFNQEHSEGKRVKVTQNLALFFEGITSAKRKILKSYKDCRCLSAFVLDTNGRTWAVGLQIVNGKLVYKLKTNGAGSTNTGTSGGDDDSGFTRLYKWTVKDDAPEITAKGDNGGSPFDSVEEFLDSISDETTS